MMYTLANPGASDSPAGIARWWLDPGQVVDMQALDDALQWLVEQDVFAQRVGADGRRSYRRTGSDAQLAQLIEELEP